MAIRLEIDVKGNLHIISEVRIKDGLLLLTITGYDNKNEFMKKLDDCKIYHYITTQSMSGRYTSIAIPVDEVTDTHRGDGIILNKVILCGKHVYGYPECEMVYGEAEVTNDYQKALLNSVYGKAAYMANKYSNVAKIDYTTLHKGGSMTNELTTLEKRYMVHDAALTWEHSMNRLLLPKFRSATQPDLSGHIKKVIFSDPVTVIIWDDGSKTRVRAQGDTPYDPMVGMAMCISKYALGNTNKWFDTFKKWLPEEEKEPETRVEFTMAFDDVAKKIREIVENISSASVTVDKYDLKSTTPKDLGGAFHMFVVNPDLESLHIMTDSCLKDDGVRYSKHYISRCLSRYRNEYILGGECRFEIIYNKENDYIIIRTIK